MDPMAVYEAVSAALARARGGHGPTLIECKTYRWYGHSRSDPRKYRSKEEEQSWHDKDPLVTFSARLVQAGIATQEQVDAVEAQAEQAIEQATTFAINSPMPDAAEVEKDVYLLTPPTAPEIEAERRLRERVRTDGTMRVQTYVEALRDAMREEMLRDPNVFIMGEDVGLYGGAYGATRGLFDEFGGERVMDTPISEALIGGAAVGAAMTGARPVAEIMYVDFTPLAMDQIANQGAKNRYMFGGKAKLPMVIRTTIGGGKGYAGQHSQSLEAVATMFPGLKVVAPSTAYDLKGLLKAAIRDDNPVVFIEHQNLYLVKDPVPEEDYTVPLGVGKVVREGTDITVIAYSWMMQRALEAADKAAEAGISVEIVDPRTLVPLDEDLISASVRKTGRLLCVQQAPEIGCYAEHIAYKAQEACFACLKAPVKIVAAHNVPPPMAATLEAEFLPSADKILKGIQQTVGR